SPQPVRTGVSRDTDPELDRELLEAIQRSRNGKVVGDVESFGVGGDTEGDDELQRALEISRLEWMAATETDRGGEAAASLGHDLNTVSDVASDVEKVLGDGEEDDDPGARAFRDMLLQRYGLGTPAGDGEGGSENKDKGKGRAVAEDKDNGRGNGADGRGGKFGDEKSEGGVGRDATLPNRGSGGGASGDGDGEKESGRRHSTGGDVLADEFDEGPGRDEDEDEYGDDVEEDFADDDDRVLEQHIDDGDFEFEDEEEDEESLDDVEGLDKVDVLATKFAADNDHNATDLPSRTPRRRRVLKSDDEEDDIAKNGKSEDDESDIEVVSITRRTNFARFAVNAGEPIEILDEDDGELDDLTRPGPVTAPSSGSRRAFLVGSKSGVMCPACLRWFSMDEIVAHTASCGSHDIDAEAGGGDEDRTNTPSPVSPPPLLLSASTPAPRRWRTAATAALAVPDNISDSGDDREVRGDRFAPAPSPARVPAQAQALAPIRAPIRAPGAPPLRPPTSASVLAPAPSYRSAPTLRPAPISTFAPAPAPAPLPALRDTGRGPPAAGALASRQRPPGFATESQASVADAAYAAMRDTRAQGPSSSSSSSSAAAVEAEDDDNDEQLSPLEDFVNLHDLARAGDDGAAARYAGYLNQFQPSARKRARMAAHADDEDYAPGGANYQSPKYSSGGSSSRGGRRGSAGGYRRKFRGGRRGSRRGGGSGRGGRR
ncbi:hypothetical protein HK405_007307, partial [Cladochytrium tenue]